jgi:hypothetical protein
MTRPARKPATRPTINQAIKPPGIMWISANVAMMFLRV